MEITFVDHGIPWKNHGIVFLNFCGNPDGIVFNATKKQVVDISYCIKGKIVKFDVSDQ